MPGYLPPDYIDNQRETLAETLTKIIRDLEQREASIATGFFDPRVWEYLREALSLLNELRLLIGKEPELTYGGLDRLDLRRLYCQKLQSDLENTPYDPAHVQLITELIEFLRREAVSVKLYKKGFLHAKAYIFPEIAIVGSSNLTPYGLTHNSELNLVRKERSVAKDLKDWFDKFWQESEDYTSELIETLEASKFGGKPYTPYEVFIKVLYEYFKDRITPEAPERHLGVELAAFQEEGLKEALRILERYRCVLIADAVGLGKTYIGLGLLEHYLLGKRRRGHIPKGLVICPAQLRDILWMPKLAEHGLSATVLSQEEVSRKDFPWKAYRNYDLVLVDESHNFRNPGAQRSQNLLKLLATGKRDKYAILMTATPINNSIWDLYHQMMLMARGSDEYFRDVGISNLKGFFRRVDQGAAELFDLLEETTVRRSRSDIRKRQQAGEQVVLNGQAVRFPERSLLPLDYDLVAAYQGFYKEIANSIEALSLVSYNIEEFKKDRDPTRIQSNTALIGIMKTLFLKRLESSVQAFEVSVRRQQQFQQQFFEYLLKNKLLDASSYRKILALEQEDEAQAISEIIGGLPEVSIADYDLKAIRHAVEMDLKVFESIVERLEKIRQATEANVRLDRKLERLKEMLLEGFKGQKVLIFSYYQDTALHIYEGLRSDAEWSSRMGFPRLGLVCGARSVYNEPSSLEDRHLSREQLIKHFAPVSNAVDGDELKRLREKEIQILISTDVLSEGQNLQDAAVCINYDLHWNPVRMIQRAGRIDRLNTKHSRVIVGNFFPERGLDELLGLVKRLQQRIEDIGRTVGLDSSILGERVTERSLEELKRLKAGDRSIWDELEREAELVSLDEMKYPLIQCLHALGEDHLKEIPLGIHSGKRASAHGVFVALRARDRHFWRFYPADGSPAWTEKRKLFRLIRCEESEARQMPTPKPDVFSVIDRAVQELLRELKGAETARRIKQPLKGLNLKIYTALHQPSLTDSSIPPELLQRLSQVLEEASLKSFERDLALKTLWEEFEATKDVQALAESLDAFFVENELYQEATPPTVLEQIKKEDIQLIAYEFLSAA
jgi:hypothetical protein